MTTSVTADQNFDLELNVVNKKSNLAYLAQSWRNLADIGFYSLKWILLVKYA